jgi:hypothetical protein
VSRVIAVLVRLPGEGRCMVVWGEIGEGIIHENIRRAYWIECEGDAEVTEGYSVRTKVRYVRRGSARIGGHR